MINISYFKRFRMEIDLNDLPPPEPLPASFSWVAWDDSLVETHADVKALCFAEEIDSVVFPSLSNREGCGNLMREIRRKQGFQPEATWLILHDSNVRSPKCEVRSPKSEDARSRLTELTSDFALRTSDTLFCATVQGIRERSGLGAIQNLGVTPPYRGRGLGRALLLKSLYGFWRAGLGRAHLEVTAQNEAAIRLYRRVGFRCRKTIYRAVDKPPLLKVIGENCASSRAPLHVP